MLLLILSLMLMWLSVDVRLLSALLLYKRRQRWYKRVGRGQTQVRQGPTVLRTSSQRRVLGLCCWDWGWFCSYLPLGYEALRDSVHVVFGAVVGLHLNIIQMILVILTIIAIIIIIITIIIIVTTIIIIITTTTTIIKGRTPPWSPGTSRSWTGSSPYECRLKVEMRRNEVPSWTNTIKVKANCTWGFLGEAAQESWRSSPASSRSRGNLLWGRPWGGFK